MILAIGVEQDEIPAAELLGLFVKIVEIADAASAPAERLRVVRVSLEEAAVEMIGHLDFNVPRGKGGYAQSPAILGQALAPEMPKERFDPDIVQDQGLSLAGFGPL